MVTAFGCINITEEGTGNTSCTETLGRTKQLVPDSMGFPLVLPPSNIRLRTEAHVMLHHGIHFTAAGATPHVADLVLADRACSLLAQPWINAVHMKLMQAWQASQ